MKALRKILCVIGRHRWGPIEDYFAPIPSEADCARLLYGGRSWANAWPNYPYQRCEICAARKDLPKTYGEMRRDLPKAHAQTQESKSPNEEQT